MTVNAQVFVNEVAGVALFAKINVTVLAEAAGSRLAGINCTVVSTPFLVIDGVTAVPFKESRMVFVATLFSPSLIVAEMTVLGSTSTANAAGVVELTKGSTRGTSARFVPLLPKL